jgi:hypothetical protein
MDQRNVLLGNALDALDRLFDREAGVLDIYAIVYATAQALREDPLFPILDEAAAKLLEFSARGEGQEAARESALQITDSLRGALAESMPLPTDGQQ